MGASPAWYLPGRACDRAGADERAQHRPARVGNLGNYPAAGDAHVEEAQALLHGGHSLYEAIRLEVAAKS